MSNKLVTSGENQHRALKLRIYPSNEQKVSIEKTFGCCRQIYNNRLFERNQFYEQVIKPANPDEHKLLWKTAHFNIYQKFQVRLYVQLQCLPKQPIKTSLLL